MNIGILVISSDGSKLSGNAAVAAAVLSAVVCKYMAPLRGHGRGRDIVFFLFNVFVFLVKNGDCGHLVQLCAIFGFRLENPAVFYWI